jgi:hypothetical protein
MRLFEKIANNLAPHPDKAQIVLGLDGAGPGLDKTLKLLYTCENNRPEDGLAAELTETVLVINTGVLTCRELVLKLSESGFSRLQAVYPLAPKD